MCFFKKKVVEPETIKPTSNVLISYIEVRSIIRNVFPEANIYISDMTSLLCSPNDIALFLAQDSTNKYDYEPDVYDCDDFAYRLMGQFSIPYWSHLAFGIIWTSDHALNCFIDEDKKLRFVEPQTDEIFDEVDGEIRFIII